MKLGELKRLSELIRLIGVDTGADANLEAVIPFKYESCTISAETELSILSANDMETFAYGEETERENIAENCPHAEIFAQASFDGGDLSEIVFIPWETALDSLESNGSPKSEKARL
jgi:hypothetical protein